MQQGYDLMVAPTGARLQKTDHPAVPLLPQEILETAISCAKEGATAIHAHVRDQEGVHSIDADRYNSLANQISKKTDLHIQVSTESAGFFGVAAQRQCLANVKTRDVSVSVREINREPDQVRDFYDLAVRRGISIQHILYDANDLALLQSLYEDGGIPTSLNRAIFVLGRYSSDMQSAPSDLDPFLQAGGNVDLVWSVCAFGRQEHNCLLAALDNGGHVRIGFENSFTRPDGTIHPDNAASVAMFVEAAQKKGFGPRNVAP